MKTKKNLTKKSSPTRRKQAVTTTPARSVRFPIVALGASAGGLEALESFLSHVPPRSGLAFVIIQHLDPTHKGAMVELLQRMTTIKVVEATDRTRVKPDVVYVIPSNKDMSILHGVLHLLEPVAPRGLRLPIDHFFRSLADDRQQDSIAVILSGMGSDGTLGVRAVKEKSGAIFVQEPGSARFDSMPLSAIDTGLADVIAPVEELPDRIITYLQHTSYRPAAPASGKTLEQSAFEKVIILLRSQTGHDFSMYKKTTILRRIERRMALHQFKQMTRYVRYLQENPQEVEFLFRELLIGVTSFFRDPEAWEQIRTEVLPPLLAGRRSNPVLRAWVPACATGEEAYSLAILFSEAVEKLKGSQNIKLQIFATDLDSHAIEKAREGLFPPNISADVSAKRLDRYFVKVERGYQVSKSIREMIVFAPQNIIMDPPFTKLDILTCRNLLIYLSPELQKKLLPLFHYSLNPGGFLFLGNAETIGTFSDMFTPLSGKSRIYQRTDSPRTLELVGLPPALLSSQANQSNKPIKPANSLQALADDLLLQKYAPAAALTNENGDILYINGRTGRYLEPAAGNANWNIFVMAREGLRYGLMSAFQKVVRERETVVVKDLIVETSNNQQTVSITMQPVKGPGQNNNLVMIVFSDEPQLPRVRKTGRLRKNSDQIAQLEQQLANAQQEVQSIREEMQTSQEELKSSNEEMQSTNEELQSTNEELTTSKEELQSMNEELHTLNQELQSRLDELSHTNNDMKNLLDSTNIATLFLDGNLCVRRFTNEMGKLTRLLPGDVGRPITDIASELLYPELAEDVRTVLETLEKREKHILLPTGTWFAARILPYRTFDNRIDGVVITFTDITAHKALEMELRRKNTG